LEKSADVAALVRVLRKLEERQGTLQGQLREAQQKEAHPQSESWGEAQSLAATIDTAPDPQEARLRLRTALGRIVDSIWVLVVPRGSDRLCEAQLWFSGCERYRTYFIVHRPPRSNGKKSQPGRWLVRSVTQPDDRMLFEEYDLRDPGEVAKAVKFLEDFTREEIDEMLAAAATQPQGDSRKPAARNRKE